MAASLVAGSAVAAAAQNFRVGSEGPEVRQIQRRLGVSVTGFYGPETEQAATDFQRRQRLNCIDGITGPETLTALGLESLVTTTNSCIDGRRIGLGDDFYFGSSSNDNLFVQDGRSGFWSSAPYIVAIPGRNPRDLDRAQDIIGDAFIDFNTSRFGPFIRAGSFSSHQRAREQSWVLRRQGLDARVIYGPLGR